MSYSSATPEVKSLLAACDKDPALAALFEAAVALPGDVAAEAAFLIAAAAAGHKVTLAEWRAWLARLAKKKPAGYGGLFLF